MADLVFINNKPSNGQLTFGAALTPDPLVFTDASAATGLLVFGADTVTDSTSPTAPTDASITVDVTCTAMASCQIAVGVPISADTTIPPPQADVQIKWDANTYRTNANHTQRRLQQAQKTGKTTQVKWRNAHVIKPTFTSAWQQAQATSQVNATKWRSTQTHYQTTCARWQQAQSISTAARLIWQSASPIRNQSSIGWQQAQRINEQRAVRWQSGVPVSSAQYARWQAAQGISISRSQYIRLAQAVNHVIGVRWQQAMSPPAGRSVFVIDVPRDVCYTPPNGDAVELLFTEPAATDASLLFKCNKWAQPTTTSSLVIPILDVYMHIHNLSATLYPSGEPLAIKQATISTDSGGYAWQLQASGAVWLMEQLAPVNNQQPQVKIEIDGVAWIFTVHSRSRNRAWAEHTTSITGASSTSLLSQLPTKTFSNTAARNAQQLVGEALDLTGTTVDWQLPDWQVPAGVWSFTGTPLAAVLRIADAVGAVVQSDNTAQTLRFLPRYKSLPWEWASATPDITLPIGYAKTDSFNETKKPDYNKVYTAGTIAGTIKSTKRAGTAGDLIAPMAVDALLTGNQAHTERAKAILGGAGWQADVAMTLPVNTSAGYAGVLGMGDLIKIQDTDGDWHGMVRSISITAGDSPEVNQTVQLERHL